MVVASILQEDISDLKNIYILKGKFNNEQIQRTSERGEQ